MIPRLGGDHYVIKSWFSLLNVQPFQNLVYNPYNKQGIFITAYNNQFCHFILSLNCKIKTNNLNYILS